MSRFLAKAISFPTLAARLMAPINALLIERLLFGNSTRASKSFLSSLIRK
jgi:hypothetical protein